MKVQEIMTANPECVSPATTIRLAAEKMAALDVGILPVCEEDRLVGVITDRDITIRVTALGQDSTLTIVGDVMTTNVVCCYEDDELENCIEIMEGAQVRRVPVLNREEKLAGIVALGDLVNRRRENDEVIAMAEEVLEKVSEPER